MMKIFKIFLPAFAICIPVLILQKRVIHWATLIISGLGGDTWAQGPIDKWIYDSLTVPFNIDVKYKWDEFALDQLDKTVVPVKEPIVIPLLSCNEEGMD